LKTPSSKIGKVFLPLFVSLPSRTKEKIILKSKKKKELLFVNKKKQKNFNNFWPVAFERPREAE
jgi:hypothetical protein